MLRPSILALLLLTSACARGTPPAAASGSAGPSPLPAAPAPSDRFAPLVDHHLHLLSAAGAATALREVELPSDLAALLDRRRRAWNDSAALAALYLKDAALFGGSKWVEGAAAIAPHLATGYTGPYRFKPGSFRVEGASAQISGFLLEDDGTETPFGFFHLALRQAGGGEWRIASEVQTFPGPALDKPVTAADMVARLDEAGIPRGVILSDAYYFALTPDMLPGEYERVRAENDWTAAQVAQFPHRLVAFCSFNPLRDYALAELERCSAGGGFRGIKLHFNAAQIDYRDPAQVAKARRVMEAANRHRLPVIAHVRSTNDYGREDAEIFLRRIVAAAPDVVVQIAHLWGGETFSPGALDVYAEAVAAGDPVARNLYFDISGFGYNGKPEYVPKIVAAIRRIGLSRILYASDAPPAEAWRAFRELPLTEAELRAIASNVAPYMAVD